MTTEQVPLAAQIEKVQRELRYAQEDHAEMAERLWSAVLATLQQHERALAALRSFRYAVAWIAADSWDWTPEIRQKLAHAQALADAEFGPLTDNEIAQIGSALDDAASAAGDTP